MTHAREPLQNMQYFLPLEALFAFVFLNLLLILQLCLKTNTKLLYTKLNIL